MEKWGLGWDVLSKQNHKLVMVRISGFGQTGPYSPRPGFGRIGNAFGGLSYLAGYPDRPPVTPGSATIPDYMAGLYGALGVMFALRARDMTGRGQFIDIGLYEPIFRILDELAAVLPPQRLRARAHGARHRQRRAAQPLPDQGRQVDRHRLHVRQDLRAPGRVAGRARSSQVRASGERSRTGSAIAPRSTPGSRAGPQTMHARRADRPLQRIRGAVRAGQLDCRDLRGPAVQGAREHQVLQGPARGRDRHAERRARASPTRRARSNGWGPKLGEHNDDVYKALLGMSDREIGVLQDKGVI